MQRPVIRLAVVVVASVVAASCSRRGEYTAPAAADVLNSLDIGGTVYVLPTPTDPFTDTLEVTALKPIECTEGGDGKQEIVSVAAGDSATIPVGRHRLWVPLGSVAQQTTFRVTALDAGRHQAVRITTRPKAALAAPVELTLRSCGSTPLSKLRIVRLKPGAPGENLGGGVPTTSSDGITVTLTDFSDFILASAQ